MGFRKGEKVICIDNSDYFAKGEEYTVARGACMKGGFIKVKENMGYDVLVTPSLFRYPSPDDGSR